jgi:sugar lactone lactonase YvrE
MWRWLAACTPPEGPSDADTTPTAAVHSALVTATGDSAALPEHTGPTGTPTTAPGCGPAPAGPFPVTSSDEVHTEEDFDFDPTGLVLSQRFENLIGIERDGTSQIVATQIGYDAAGIRSLPTGEVLVAQPDTGSLQLVDPSTGGSVPLIGSLAYPNGLEVGVDGSVFVSEFVRQGHVRWYDPSTEAFEPIADLEYPNGMVLSPDEQTLYVVSSEGLLGFGASTIYTLQRNPDGSWDPALTLFRESATTLGGMTTDSCGNLYVIEYNGGRLIRIEPDGTTTDLATLPGAGTWSSLRFSPGIGSWPRTEVYATNRRELYGIEVGIEGRHVLSP